jgi:hypothetical protein
MAVDRKNRAESSDFWVGVFPDEVAFSEYFGEAPDYYDFLKDSPAFVKVRRKGAPPDDRHKPRTRFLADHDQVDFCNFEVAEMGFNCEAVSIAELIEPYSCSDRYGDELTRRAGDLGIDGINSFVFVSTGAIRSPRTIQNEDFQLYYVGSITYRI